jgi:2-polyprenyl-3-methyl-5-hydroxy-6-metoxy-1,4-benzoquinol methylase
MVGRGNSKSSDDSTRPKNRIVPSSMSGPFDEGYYRQILYREAPNSQRNRRRLAEVLRCCSGGRLLEVGCAEGGFLSLAAARFEVQGVDLSAYAVRAVQEQYGFPARVADIEKERLEGEAYDVIVAFNVLEHLADPASGIARLYEALQDGGLMIGSVPNNGGIVGRTATFIGNRLDRTHCSTFPPAAWRALFKAQGFTSIRFFGEMNLGRNRSLFIKNRAWKHIALALMFVCRKPFSASG